MKFFIFINLILFFSSPSFAVTTRMFKVLDTCARYRINEINSFEAIEKLKLKYIKEDTEEAGILVAKYCSVFTPNEKIKY